MGKQKDLSDFDKGQIGQLVNRHQGHGQRRLIDGHGERQVSLSGPITQMSYYSSNC